MNLDLTEKDARFRDEVRAFLDEALTDDLREAGRLSVSAFTEKRWNMAWHKALYEKGWVAPGWPKEYGGPGWSEMQRYIFASECAAAEAPSLSPLGLRMCGPMLMGYGTKEQKDHYLPRILSGEHYWCQGYSEPGSGSDLASLQLKAVRDGDDYVLNGTKIWTTHAHEATHMFCLVRTDGSGKPQEGITFVLLEMASPGITVEPIITLAGDHEVNQVFFDDVRVPVANRVGEEGEGWEVAKYLLEFERGGAYAAGLKTGVQNLREIAARERSDGARLADRPDFAQKLDEADIEVTAIEFTEHRIMAEIAQTGQPGPASSMLKTRGTEMRQRLDELAVETVGFYAAPLQRDALTPGANVEPVGPSHAITELPRYLNNRASSIYGGSNEIQRNIMAKLVLGL